MKLRFHFFIVSCLLFSISLLHALPHISGEHFKGQPTDYVHHIPNVRKLASSGLSLSEIQKVIGTTGIKNVAVILIEFPSLGSDTSGENMIKNKADIVSNINKVRDFYYESSYHQLELIFTIIPSTYVYKARWSMSYYGYPEHGDELIQEAISKSGVTKAAFDAVLVVHAGYGNESSSAQFSGDIWSAFYTFPIVNGFTEGLVVPEFERNAFPLGVYCHEMGHQLGLPDLYSTDGRLSPYQVGVWCLMDYGAWVNNGNNPTHPNIWCKQILGWVNSENLSLPSQITLPQIEISSDSKRINIPSAPEPSKEYFLIEYRSAAAGLYDRYLPNSGVLIWHVDESVIYGQVNYEGITDTRLNHNIINNSYQTNHRGIELVPADYSDPSANKGDDTDVWPGIKNVFTVPYSNSFNGLGSGITIADFSIIGNMAKIVYTQIALADTLLVNKMINYPNPAGKGYFHPRQNEGILTTLVFNFARPPQKMDVTIFDVSGDKVLFIPNAKIKFQTNHSANYIWTYEYDWDGKNDNGQNVAAGIYLYRLKADTQTKIGKLAIVR